MNNSVTIAYKFEITLQLCLFDGSKPKNNDEHQPRLSNFFKNFDSNGGNDLCYQGGLDQSYGQNSGQESRDLYLEFTSSFKLLIFALSITARKRVGPLPTHRLAVRHSVDYSSSDHFSLDDSLRDSSSSSSSDSSSDSSTDALSYSASSRSSFDHSLPTPSSDMRPSHHLCSLVSSIHRSSAAISERPSHDSSYASPSCKRSISPVAFVPLSSPTLGVLSYACADLLPLPKRIRSHETATDLEGCSKDSFEPYVPREAGLRVDFEDEKIDECTAYVDALRGRGIDARVVAEAIDREEIETSMSGLVENFIVLCIVCCRAMPNTLSGASRTREGINEQIDRQMAGAL
ncbi:hypothetical protein Tco_0918318 [Tanacetum coccineum]